MYRLDRLTRGVLIALVVVLSLVSLNIDSHIAQAKNMNGPLSAAWSPDGKQILMTVIHNETSLSLNVLDVKTGKLTRLGDEGVDAAWSPDGSQIVYSGGQKSGVFIANKDGSQPTKVASIGYVPTWSPDGKEIRFLLYNAVAKIKIGSKQLERITEQKGQNIVSYAWSPDQKLIAFTAFPDNNTVAPTSVYIMNADGSNLRKLAGSFESADIAWSPDSKYLATASDCGAGHGLCVWDADGSNPRKLNNYGENPQWSPDSSQIAFVRGGRICLINADGSGEHCLTSDYTGSRPIWSPDGKQLLFTATISEGNDKDFKVTMKLNLINADGTGFEQLVP